MKKFKVGDKVKVLVEGSFGSEAEKGRIYTIETVDYDDNSIELEELPAFDQWVYMDDVEIVSESSYKVGDKVKVLAENPCSSGAEKGKVYTVKEVGGSGVRLKEVAHFGGWVSMHYVELVNKTSFTFPEMAQKLIDGEFEVGTELVADGKSYFVDRVLLQRKYGLKSNEEGSIVSTTIGANAFNAAWTVKEELTKEETIKEMSIEEVQKELGYKIKITE